MQLNHEIFQKDTSCENQNALEMPEFFKKNDLKAQLQAKDTTIRQLKEHIKSMRETNKKDKVKQDIDEIETINNELEHSVAKLLYVNERLYKEIEHLKQIYKDEFDSIKKTCVRTTEHRKDVVENGAQIPKATTITPGMFKLDLEPLDPRLGVYSAYKYVKLIQELLVYVRDTCPGIHKPNEKLVAVTPLNKIKKVRFSEPLTSSSKQMESLKTQDSNKPVLPSTGMKSFTSSSRSQPSGNTKNNRILPSTSSNKKNKVEVQPWKVKSSSNKKNHVKEPIRNANVKHTTLNANSELIYVKCNQCMFDANHDVCFLEFVNDVNVRGDPQDELSLYRRPKVAKSVRSSSKSKIIESRISNNSESNHSWGSTASNVPSSSLVDFRFGNDQISKIMGYGDYQMRNVTISWVYYVEGLGHNLFSIRQFCDSDLEVAFHKHICYIRDLEGIDLLKGSRGSNLYTLSLEDMMSSSPICLFSKASKTKSWLWHRRLSHLNFDYITTLAKQRLVHGLPRLKFQKDHLYSACALGKSKKHSHKPKAEDSIQEKLYLLHMDLCGPMRIHSMNGRKYIMVIVNDYSRFTWVTFLRSKDEVPEFVIKFLKMIQVCLNATVCNIRTDNDTEFVNPTLKEYYENVRISHQTSVARTLQQNNVVERRNRTLVEAARTMLIFSKAPLFLWAEAVTTSCFTQNRSLIRKRHNKTPYELLHNKKPD
ncbi:retrovirus-related pol polyprotein from transposon TNT 1-94 [Tanacetum coccineum]|uniref:Retrovirus-related pol polyprotein from transposon TNT 1-94 n=1 Tax=Tanacetum coccineum TaxID=301880 RepID=A0ABQ4XN97_9ASTR